MWVLLSVAGRSVPGMTASTTAAGPAEFRRAVARLDVARVRAEVELGPLPAPARLAPWSHALSATLYPAGTDEETASGRMILLFDPDGVDAWGGSLRVVVFATCELDTEIALDPLLPEVAWSWLTESLDASGAGYSALGGTVTATSSTRFGDIAGPAARRRPGSARLLDGRRAHRPAPSGLRRVPVPRRPACRQKE